MSSVIGKMEITKIVDNEDGSATVMFDMDWDAIHAFAKIGLMQVLTEAAQDMLDQNEIGLMQVLTEAAQDMLDQNEVTDKEESTSEA